MDSQAPKVSEQVTATAPAIDQHTFDQEYFTKVSNYAGKYDRYNPPHKIAGYLAEIRRLVPSGTLLDAGCAFGKFLHEARKHYDCEGLDISEYALTVARQRVPGLQLHHAAIEGFNPGRTYDVVTCFDVLEHIPSLDLALASLRRLLSSRSVLAMAVPVYDTLPGWGFRLVDKDPTHLHKFDREDWLARFRRMGLDPVAAKGCLRAPLPGYFLHKIGRVFWWFSSAIFVICRPA